MTTALATTQTTALQTQETNLPVDISWGDLQVALTGNLARLSAEGQVKYYNALCKFTGLNPLGFPFAWITFQGKLVLYAKKECAEQLSGLHKITTKVVSRSQTDDIYVVTVSAEMPGGQRTESSGAVPWTKGMAADAKCNALKKAETQAKRRAVFSLVGLGVFDQDEAESLPKVQSSIDEAHDQSAASRAEKLNAQIEQSKPIEATIVSESTPPVAQVATAEPIIATGEASAPAISPVAPSSPTPTSPQPTNQPAATPPQQAASSAAAAGLQDSDAPVLTPDETKNIEIVLSEHPQVTKCVAFLVEKGALPAGKPIEYLKRNWFVKTMANPKALFRLVDAWVKEGAK